MPDEGGAPEQLNASRVAENGRIASALHQRDLTALVDVTPERALVRYNVDQASEMQDTMWRVLGALASAEPESELIVLQVYLRMDPWEELEATTDSLRRLRDGVITPQEFFQEAKRHRANEE